MLIAVQNAQADLRAGFTAARDMSSHGNGYGDVEIRNAINQGRIDGPRYQVSTLGIVWGAAPPNPAAPDNPLASTVVRSVEEGARRRARADRARRRLDQAVPGRRAIRSRRPARPSTQVTYPLPVLQALIDETHRLGKKAGCHVYGGEGQKNAIVAGCDTIEHGFGLDQEQVNMMVAKGLYYDPTLRPLHRAVHGRQRRQEHRRQVPDDSDLREGRGDGRRHQGTQDHDGQRRRWLDVSRTARRRSSSRRW